MVSHPLVTAAKTMFDSHCGDMKFLVLKETIINFEVTAGWSWWTLKRTDELEARVQHLHNASAFEEFFQRFGTHVISSAKLGGTAIAVAAIPVDFNGNVDLAQVLESHFAGSEATPPSSSLLSTDVIRSGGDQPPLANTSCALCSWKRSVVHQPTIVWAELRSIGRALAQQNRTLGARVDDAMHAYISAVARDATNSAAKQVPSSVVVGIIISVLSVWLTRR
jgi:hypothetical protein